MYVLVLAAILFILYPAVRPWGDESTVEGATASMASGAWVWSHLFAMAGFVLVALGLLAVRDRLAVRAGVGEGVGAGVGDSVGGRVAGWALATFWIGAGATLPYYGAEDFALHAIATSPQLGGTTFVLDLAEQIRYQPVAVTAFGVGLVLMAAGAILAAVAVARANPRHRYLGIPFALGFALFLPQFYAPPAARIAHGVLVAIGCCLLALTLRRPVRSTME